MAYQAWFEAQFAAIRPKAIAALTRQFRNLDLAEEAFSAGCLKALNAWPKSGMPNDPFAWLLSVSRRAGLDIIRRDSRLVYTELEPATDIESEDNSIELLDHAGLRDDVLRLLFICCHPDLSHQDQLALALRIVIGMSVSEIARAFLVKSKTMEQRITRAKRLIASAGVPFDTPDLAERHKRLKTVSLMIYLLFNEGWSASSGEFQIKTTLCEEALRLSRLMLALFPSNSELMGLLSLFLLLHSRQKARIDSDENLRPLETQNRDRWDQQMISEALPLLEKALYHRSPGPYQIQAAIAATHARARYEKETNWAEIERLYAALYEFEPTPIIKLNHATAIAKTRGAQAALDILNPLETSLANYRWFHSTRAALLFELNDYVGAKVSYQQAYNLEITQPERRLIIEKIAQCEKKIQSLSDCQLL